VETVDQINARFWRETIWYAAAGRTPGWKMRQQRTILRRHHSAIGALELPGSGFALVGKPLASSWLAS
jgi:hypothetical protein